MNDLNEILARVPDAKEIKYKKHEIIQKQGDLVSFAFYVKKAC